MDGLPNNRQHTIRHMKALDGSLRIVGVIGYVDYEFGDLLKDVDQTVTIYFSTPPTPLQMFRI